MSDESGQRPVHVTALADQIHAAIRDKDSDRLADTVRSLFHRDPDAARALLRESLHQMFGVKGGDDPPPRTEK